MSAEQTRWVASLSPWPADGFGLDRMRALLLQLGEPQRAFAVIHVVGTNGKSTATRVIEALLLADDLVVGSTVSPHVRAWSERIRVNGEDADFEVAVERVRNAAERLGATQFETITAAAFAEFATRDVDVAVVEAGLGGRLDATNVLEDTRVVLLTNVGLDHTEVLGESKEEIAREKLAVAHADSIVVVSDNRYTHLVSGRVILGGAREAAEAFVGHTIDADARVSLPGRLEQRPGEIRDGAHNPDGARWLVEQLAAADHTLCVSILGDKDVDEILRELSRAGRRLVATQSSNARALPAEEVAVRARPFFDHVETITDPSTAVARAHELGEPVLVTGSLYLLADLEAGEGG